MGYVLPNGESGEVFERGFQGEQYFSLPQLVNSAVIADGT